MCSSGRTAVLSHHSHISLTVIHLCTYITQREFEACMCMYCIFSCLNSPNGCPGIKIRNIHKHTCLHRQKKKIFFHVKFTLGQLNILEGFHRINNRNSLSPLLFSMYKSTEICSCPTARQCLKQVLLESESYGEN